VLKAARSETSRHFLFYFKDETFECDAEGWAFKVLKVSDAEYERLRASECGIALPGITLSSLTRDLLFEPFCAFSLASPDH
jgi:hypothetical protein